MKDFAEFENISGSFPDTQATNSSGPTMRDGTPVNADLVNDIWGFFQALLEESDQAPNTDGEYAERVTNGASGSQGLRAVRALGGAPGEIVYFAGNSFTGGGLPDILYTPTRLLALAGQTVPISSYPHLVTATYIGNANNADTDYPAFYKCSDSGGTTRSTSGTYFKLPDCRGMFIRGLDDGVSGNDEGRTEQGNTSIMGTEQDQNVSKHFHYVADAQDSNTDAKRSPVYASGFCLQRETLVTGSGGVGRIMYVRSNVAYTSSNSHLVTSFPEGTDSGYGLDEVRPKNIAFAVMIRY